MNRTWAMRPGEYAQGPRVVSATLRPVRPAALIPEDDPGMAARFAQSRSLAWGGHACYALPFSRSEGLREPWRRLLDLLDPDQVYALGISRPRRNYGIVNMNAPQREPPKPLVDRMSDGLGRLLYTAEEGPERLFTGTSTLMHSVLRAVGEGLKPTDGGRFVVVPRVQRGYSSSPYLPVVARYGGVDDAEVERHLNGVHSHRREFDLDLSEHVRIEEVGGAGDLLGVLSGDLNGLLEDEEAKHALTLPQLTSLNLQIECRGTPYGASRRPPGALEDSRYGPVIVTGPDDSVEDFALFWTLRSELYFARPFPLWIPIDLLEGEEAPAAIEAALGRVRPSVGEASPRQDDVLIVSASMDTTELRERLGNRYPEARIGTEDLVGLFTATCEYYYAKEKQPAHFDRGRASIQPPRPEELKKNLMPQIDYVAYEVDVDGMWLPQSKAMAWNLGWPDFHFRDNASKRGNLRFVKQFNKDFSESGLLDLRTPDGWTLIRSVFEERGYDVSPTAKSRTALGQLALLGGVENLKVAASSKVHALLKEMSAGRGEGRAFVSDRKTEPLGRFDRAWGREDGRDLLRWLIGRRLLFRGAEIRCPRCELGRWYEIDRIGETWRCDGCKEDMPIPLNPDATHWRYRINELYAHGHDQGTLTPLLTLNAMHTAWGTSSIYGGLSFYPGVEIRAKEGADVPFDHREIDLVAMRNGELILAECKESAEHLSRPEEASLFAQQLGDLAVLADHLGASRLLVASSTEFPADKAALLAEVPTDASAEIEWLDAYDLLDPNIILHPLSHPTATGERAGKPDGWESSYLDWARRSVTGQAD